MKKNTLHDKPLISVIIPVYNVELYLEYCVQSILIQDYNNLEIILIDDGSTDSSKELCDKFAKKDSRVIVIHKQNGGLSSARNVGLHLATGSFITFIDSDDYVKANYISQLFNCITNTNSDISICGYKKTCNNISYIADDTFSMCHSYDHEYAEILMCSRKLPTYAHGKLYKREIIGDSVFREGITYEDVIFNWEVVKRANKISYISKQLYFYRQRKGSIVNSCYNSSRMSQLYFSEEILSEAIKTNNTPLIKAAASKCFFSAADTYTLMDNGRNETTQYVKNAIKKYRKSAITDSNSSFCLKLIAISSYLNVYNVKLLGQIYKNINKIIWRFSY